MDKYYTELANYIKRVQPKVYTKAEYASRQSSTAYVSMYIIKDNELVNITPLYCELTGAKIDKRIWGVRFGGYGYSKTFQAVYGLGRALWPKGYKCMGEKCRSNDHANGLADRTKGKHFHSDGGYFLGEEKTL